MSELDFLCLVAAGQMAEREAVELRTFITNGRALAAKMHRCLTEHERTTRGQYTDGRGSRRQRRTTGA